MIRDPSDGTVKEIELDQREATGSRAAEKFTPASGLPMESKRPSYLERLDKSRDWLKNYRIGIVTDGARHER